MKCMEFMRGFDKFFSIIKQIFDKTNSEIPSPAVTDRKQVTGCRIQGKTKAFKISNR
jgi:hypothetical protein